MKKFFMFAAAVVALASCSSDDSVSTGGTDGGDAGAKQAIQLNVASPEALKLTRGTGTIGDLEGESNVWKGQPIYVIMTESGSITAASYEGVEGEDVLAGDIYPNTLFIAPGGKNQFVQTSEAGKVERADAYDHSIKYYPQSGTYNFFGYALGEEKGVELAETDGNFTVPVEIDGSQDLMTAIASTDEDIDGVAADKLYGAYAARRGVQPTLNFNHELSRFTFNVKAGNDKALGNGNEEQAVRVTKVVLKSKTKGTMIVARPTAYRDETNITWEDEKSELKLQQREVNEAGEVVDYLANLVELTENKVASTTEYQQIGNEALLVAPGEEIYEGYVEIIQNLPLYDEHVTAEAKDVTTTYSFTLKASDVTKDGANAGIETFAAGTSYNVNIIVYGSEEIVVNTTLVPWIDGGNIDLDPDAE